MSTAPVRHLYRTAIFGAHRCFALFRPGLCSDPALEALRCNRTAGSRRFAHVLYPTEAGPLESRESNRKALNAAAAMLFGMCMFPAIPISGVRAIPLEPRFFSESAQTNGGAASRERYLKATLISLHRPLNQRRQLRRPALGRAGNVDPLAQLETSIYRSFRRG